MIKLSNLLICLLIFLSSAYFISGYIDCNEIGGKYVRGLFWMECVTN